MPSQLSTQPSNIRWHAGARHIRFDGWTLATIALAAIMIIPLAAVLALALAPSDDIWRHLVDTVLVKYIRVTLGLMIGVGIGVMVIGTGTAWLVTMCRFPGRKIFNWALLLPLAVPAYVLAFVVTDQLEYAGTAQTALRAIFGWKSRQDYWFPEIRSLAGAISVMTLVLYPYVYLLARAAFMEQSVCVIEVSRTLGRGAWRSFFSVALPLARPAIVIGVTLAMMETVNDFGTVDFFAVNTFTAGIYDVWLNMNSRAGAAQLASVLLLFVLALIAVERWARRGQRFHHTTTKYRQLPSYRLSGGRAALAFVACIVPVALGFILPAAVLTNYAFRHYAATLSSNFLDHITNSLTLAASSSVLAVAIGVFMAYGVRLSGGPVIRAVTRLASVGYAVPGAVLAIGIVVPLGIFDNGLDALSRGLFGIPTGLLLSGTIAGLVYGYLARFLALSYGTMESSLTKITPSMDGAARTLGYGPAATLSRVHFPLMRSSLLTAAVLVFVDCMKELPLTLILRPFNYDTLATFVYQYASDELLEEAALGALAIVAAGVLPVIMLSMSIVRARPGSGHAKGEPAQ